MPEVIKLLLYSLSPPLLFFCIFFRELSIWCWGNSGRAERFLCTLLCLNQSGVWRIHLLIQVNRHDKRAEKDRERWSNCVAVCSNLSYPTYILSAANAICVGVRKCPYINARTFLCTYSTYIRKQSAVVLGIGIPSQSFGHRSCFSGLTIAFVNSEYVNTLSCNFMMYAPAAALLIYIDTHLLVWNW